MTAPYDREALVARNAAMRDRVDTMIADLQRRTHDIAELQQAVLAVEGGASSKDGTVRVRTNAAGVPLAVDLSSTAFQSSTPERLGAAVLEVAQAAARQARERSAEILAPVMADVPDLSGLVPGAPDLHVVVPTVPEAGAVPPSSTPPPGDDEDGDGSVLRGGQW